MEHGAWSMRIGRLKTADRRPRMGKRSRRREAAHSSPGQAKRHPGSGSLRAPNVSASCTFARWPALTPGHLKAYALSRVGGALANRPQSRPVRNLGARGVGPVHEHGACALRLLAGALQVPAWGIEPQAWSLGHGAWSSEDGRARGAWTPSRELEARSCELEARSWELEAGHHYQTSDPTGAIHRPRQVQAPNITADQGIVPGVQLGNMPAKQQRVADQFEVFRRLPGAGAASRRDLTDATPKGVVLPLHRPPRLLRCVSSTLHTNQPILSVPTILPTSNLRQVAPGVGLTRGNTCETCSTDCLA